MSHQKSRGFLDTRRRPRDNRARFAAENASASRTKDDDEYPRKPRLFWVRHGHYRGLTYSRQKTKSCKLLTASEMLPVTMGSIEDEFKLRNLGLVPSQRPPHTRAWLILSHLRAVIFQSDGERKSALPK